MADPTTAPEPVTLGVVTIGQTPRADLTPELRAWLPGVRIVERGALDGVTPEQIAEWAPAEGDEVLTTRLRDGGSAIVGHHHIAPGVRAAVADLEEAGVDAVYLACTGEFGELEHRGPVLRPEFMIGHAVAAIAAGLTTVGVLVPLEEQRRHPDTKYAPLDAEVVVAVATPYAGSPEAVAEGLRSAAAEFKAAGAQLIVADCIGYTQAMREVLVSELNVPVVLARSVVARLAAELLDRGAAA